MKEYCKKPCDECPFKKKSVRGFLGGYSLTETVSAANGEHDFLCHTIGRGDLDIECAGRMLYASKSGKRFRNQELEKIRIALKKSNPDYLVNILGSDEFIKHHTIEMDEKFMEWIKTRPKVVQDMIADYPPGLYEIKKGAPYTLTCAGSHCIIISWRDDGLVMIGIRAEDVMPLARKRQQKLCELNFPGEEIEQFNRIKNEGISSHVDPIWLELILPDFYKL